MELNQRILVTLVNSDSPLSSGELAQSLQVGKSTIKRHLEVLLKHGSLSRTGIGRATRYGTGRCFAPAVLQDNNGVRWRTAEAGQLLHYLQTPVTSREIVGYARAFIDDYVPNRSTLLPPALADALQGAGKMPGQQPAGTYARKVLEQLLLDLAWSSSKLEGNKYSLLATEELFRSGRCADDIDSIMLLNHKQAIEFLVDTVPEYGLTVPVITNLHSILMQDLLSFAEGPGAIRSKIINISGSTYTPLQTPVILEEMFACMITKARQIFNPVESAFFLWVNLAYLQPFEDGNKRTSRLVANIPLMICNNAPLSFLDADSTDYAYAMMGIYEKCDVSLAVELFEHLYRRSITRYRVTLEAAGAPDPFRLQHRQYLNAAMQQIVVDRRDFDAAVAATGIAPELKMQFNALLRNELRLLHVHNCARYRLTIRQVEQWNKAGRPD